MRIEYYIQNLQAITLDQEGRVSIHGSDKDKEIMQESFDAIFQYARGFETVLPFLNRLSSLYDDNNISAQDFNTKCAAIIDEINQSLGGDMLAEQEQKGETP